MFSCGYYLVAPIDLFRLCALLVFKEEMPLSSDKLMFHIPKMSKLLNLGATPFLRVSMQAASWSWQDNNNLATG